MSCVDPRVGLGSVEFDWVDIFSVFSGLGWVRSTVLNVPYLYEDYIKLAKISSSAWHSQAN